MSPSGRFLIAAPAECDPQGTFIRIKAPQYTGHEWQEFLNEHGLVCSMSRRGNCHDNAMAESFFQLLKRVRIKRRIDPTRDEARTDVFDYIEMFYNTRRRHGYNDGPSPVQYEQQTTKRLRSV